MTILCGNTEERWPTIFANFLNRDTAKRGGVTEYNFFLSLDGENKKNILVQIYICEIFIYFNKLLDYYFCAFV